MVELVARFSKLFVRFENGRNRVGWAVGVIRFRRVDVNRTGRWVTQPSTGTSRGKKTVDVGVFRPRDEQIDETAVIPGPFGAWGLIGIWRGDPHRTTIEPRTRQLGFPA